MNKKGFLLAEETLKIILAVIAIGFLVFLLFSLYNAGKKSKDLGLAKESLDFLIEEMKTEKTSVDIYNPNGWFLISWPKEGTMPESCSNLGWKNCVCIIHPSSLSFGSVNYAQDSDKGVCAEASKRTIVSSIKGEQSPIKIENPPLKLKIDYGSENLITEA